MLKLGAGEMIQLLSELVAALPKDSSLVSSAHVRLLTAAYNSCSKGPKLCPDFTDTYIHVHIQVQKLAMHTLKYTFKNTVFFF